MKRFGNGLALQGVSSQPEAPGRGMEREMNAMGVTLNRGNGRRAAMALALACVLGIGVLPAIADPEKSKDLPDVKSADAVLYEVTENMYLLDAAGNVVGPEGAVRRKADASLYGWSRVGNPLCPMDVSKRPLGKISGTFTPAGASEPTAFCGTFRLPFSVARGNREQPARHLQAYYLADDFTTLIPIQKSELSLGMPTVRLELNFHGNCPRF